MYNANVLTYFPLKARFYFTHPLVFLKQLNRNIKNAYQRIKNGYCDYDWWTTDEHLLYLIPKMLREMATKSMGYPYINKFASNEEWRKWLNEVAAEFESAQEGSPSGPQNEFEEEYDRLIEYFYLNGSDGNNVNITTTFEYDTSREHYELIAKQYNERGAAIMRERETIIKRALMKLGEYFFCLWD